MGPLQLTSGAFECPFLISWNARINLQRPALDAADERFCSLHALASEPNSNIEAAHAVMAVADHLVAVIQGLKIRRNRAHRNKLRSFDAADLELPGFADIDEQQLLAAIESELRVRRPSISMIPLGRRDSMHALLDRAFRCDPLLLHGLDFIDELYIFFLRQHFPEVLFVFARREQ